MPPLRVEYAKSGRSRCCLKECSKMIDKGEVRVGTGVMMPGMDEPSYKWRHICCFTARQAKNAGGSVDSVEGLEDLTESDRQLVVRMMKGELVGNHSLLGKTGSAGETAAASSPTKAAKPKVVGVKKRPRGGEKVADSGYASDATDDYDVEEAGTRVIAVAKPLCPYGAACFRKHPSHFAEYRHSDDGAAASSLDAGTTEIVAVVAKKRETPKDLSSEAISSSPAPGLRAATLVASSPGAADTGATKRCIHGPLCFRTDPQHRAEYIH